MSSAFSSIKQGLAEALEFSKGNASKAVIHEFTAIDVKDLRAKVGMSQNEFASAFGISVATLRHWERGDRSPQGPALVLLNVVAKEPQAVLPHFRIRIVDENFVEKCVHRRTQQGDARQQRSCYPKTPFCWSC